MRKCSRAVLALTACFSLIALLFYRNEYNKLRFVLQVVNYFGTPSKNPNETCTLTPMINNFNSDFSEPMSTWQRLSDDLYVFSAYHINDEIRAIAFGNTEKLKKNLFACEISIDPENPKRIPGELSFEIMSEDDLIDVSYVNNNKFYGLILTCKGSNISKAKKITGVEFYPRENEKSKSLIIKIRNIVENPNKSDSVICVAPPNFEKNIEGFGMKRMDMMAFIAFHKNIGLDNFIVYDFGISDVFNFGIESLSRVSGMNFTYSRVSWNFPFDGVDYRVMRHLVESDCLYRTFGRAKLAVTLSWNEYVNLKYHSSMSSVISDFNKVSVKSGDSFVVETFVLCVEENPGDSFNVSTPMIMSATKKLRGEGKREEIHVYELEDGEKVFKKRGLRRKLDDLVVVFKYEGCGGDQEVVGGQVLKGADTTPGSGIFQYYITGKLFSD